MFDASNGEPRDWMKDAALGRLLLLLRPDWVDATDWLVTNMPNAKRQPFKQIITERGGVVTRVESVGSDLVVGIETKRWRQCKAPE